MPQGLAATSAAARRALLRFMVPLHSSLSQAVAQSRASKGHPQHPRLNPARLEAAVQRVHLPGAFPALSQTNRRLLGSASSLASGGGQGRAGRARCLGRGHGGAGATLGEPLQHHRAPGTAPPRRLSRPPQGAERRQNLQVLASEA